MDNNLLKILKSPLYLSIIIYLLIMGLLVFYKPTIMFHTDGSVKDTGLGEGNSIYSFPIISILIAILIYFINVFIYIKKS